MFDSHTSEERYELKVVLIHLWRVNVKTTPGFIHIPFADSSWIKLRHIDITSCTNTVGKPRQGPIHRLNRQLPSAWAFKKHGRRARRNGSKLRHPNQAKGPQCPHAGGLTFSLALE
jgi:hypothetical protein